MPNPMSVAARSKRLSPLFLLFSLATTPGCDSGGTNVPVEGTVTHGAGPLKQGTVQFHPDASKGNKATQPAVGTIVDGKYKLAIAGKDGAPAGWYKVTITSNVPSDPKNEYSVPKSLINPAYSKVETTELTAEVKKDGGPYDFTVK
jgi:hypothetical protein